MKHLARGAWYVACSARRVACSRVAYGAWRATRATRGVRRAVCGVRRAAIRVRDVGWEWRTPRIRDGSVGVMHVEFEAQCAERSGRG